MHAPGTRAPLVHPVDLRPPTSRSRRTLQEVSGRLAGWLLVRIIGVDRVVGI